MKVLVGLIERVLLATADSSIKLSHRDVIRTHEHDALFDVDDGSSYGFIANLITS